MARLVLLLGLLAMVAGRAAAVPAFPATVARLPDGRALALYCAGSGSPTVILESGWAADAGAWWKVQPLVAATTRVCSYDRAGAGASDPGPLPRDGAAIAADLDAALTAAGIGGPLVVVGHSAGGLYARLFAARRARDVVGLVLVEPSGEHQDRRLGAAGGTAGLLARTRACAAAAAVHALPSRNPALAKCDAGKAAATYAAEASELGTLMGATSDAVDRLPPARLPVIVLSAAGGAPAWIALHAEQAARYGGEHRLVERSGHLMPKDRPDAVAQAIGEIVDRARATAP